MRPIGYSTLNDGAEFFSGSADVRLVGEKSQAEYENLRVLVFEAVSNAVRAHISVLLEHFST